MMKKRILASSMASVMALSAASSLVAFAADTEKETATKATLEAYIDEIDAFLDDGVEEYGSLQAAQLEAALEQAQVILDDSDSDSDDYTVAYQMLKAVKASLKQYTADQLAALVKSYASTFETDNILNEDLGDEIYSDGWTEFSDAYVNAEDLVDSDDLQETTDAYVALEEAYNDLSKATTITKTQFVSIMKTYAEIVNYGQYNYETWRRGTCSVTPSKNVMQNGSSTKKLTAAQYVTFGDLVSIVIGNDTDVEGLYLSASDLQKNSSTSLTRKWFSGEDLYAAIEDQYERLVTNGYSKVSDTSIVQAYQACVDAVNVFEGWTADTTVTGTQAKVKSLVNSYRTDLVVTYGESIFASIQSTYTYEDNNATAACFSYSDGKITSVSGAKVTIVVDTNTGLLALDDSEALITSVDSGDNLKEVTIAVNGDLTKYVPITAAMVESASDDLDGESISVPTDYTTALSSALTVVEAYNAATWDDDSDTALAGAYSDYLSTSATTVLDEYTTVADGVGTGSRTEWTLIYRYVKYALSDAFDETSETMYKKADVKKIIARADEIIELTADASVFGSLNAVVVKARNAAYAWLGLADANKKNYVDNDSTYGVFLYNYVDGTYYAGDSSKNAEDLTADEVYDILDSMLDDLEEMYAAYPLSFGEIADTIAEVANALDAGPYKQNVDTIKELLTSVSYELSTLDEDNVTKDKGMVAFDVNGEFQPDERLFIGDGDDDATDAEEELYNDYVALLAAIAGAEESPAIAGDVDGDGTVSVIDAQTVLNAALGKVELTAAQEAVADVDGDGSVTILDAQAILKMALNG